MNRGKGTVYEGGIRVPFIVRSPSHIVSPGRTVAHPIGVVDIFATVAEIAGVTSPPTTDSISLVEYLTHASASYQRDDDPIYTEAFAPNQEAEGEPFNRYVRAIRNGSYKLIRRFGFYEQLYEIDADPDESNNLIAEGIGGLTGAALTAYGDLTAEMEALVGTVPCDGGRQSNDLDDDGVCDFLDNCTLVANGAAQACAPGLGNCNCTSEGPCNGNQIDSDGDGFGNICDAAYVGGPPISAPEFNAFRQAFQSSFQDPEYGDGRFDMNNDGGVGGPEFNFFRLNFGTGFPGFSGLACKQFLFETDAVPGGREFVSGTEAVNSEWNGTSCPP